MPIDHPPIDHAQRRLFTAALPPAAVIVLLWTIFFFDRFFQLDLFRFGILPRQPLGLLGIVCSPFLHGSVEHLLNNSLPILVLGWLLVYFYPKAAWRVVLASWFVSGFWVWVVARESYHIGASGVVYGLAAFLFFSGLIRKRVALMAVSLIIVLLYGSMWWGVLPLIPQVSWESHLFGGITGAIMAWFYRSVPTAHVPPPLVLEDDPEEEMPSDPALTIVYEQLAAKSTDEPLQRPGADPLPGPFLYDPRSTSGTWPKE